MSQTDIAFKKIWQDVGLKGIRFEKTKLSCPFCRVHKETIIALYRHVRKHQFEDPNVSKEFVREFIVKIFTDGQTPRVKGMTEFERGLKFE
jgi:hypothetical protein